MRRSLPTLLAVGSLLLVWAFVFGRFAGRLYFVMDDYIEVSTLLSSSLGAAVRGSILGEIQWSGYRPVPFVLRALLAHTFGTERLAGYYLVSLGLHLANVLLLFFLLRAAWRGTAWAFGAALFLLLIPAPNEAVLWMTGSAGMLALLFAQISLGSAMAALHGGRGGGPVGRVLWTLAATAAYALSFLATENALALPLFVLLLDWGLGRSRPRAAGRRVDRARLGLYAAYAVVALLLVAVRLWANAGQIATARADYAVGFDPARILQGYLLIGGQFVLLHTSPWIYLPPFTVLREWMSPLNPRALASMLLTGVLAASTFFVALRTPSAAQGEQAGAGQPRPAYPFWVGWGLLWLLVLALPYTMLSARHPESRYLYLPAAGLAVAFGAAGGWLDARLRGRPWLHALPAAAAVLLLSFYAYVMTSDVAQWERAGAHARAFVEGARAQVPTLAKQSLVGLPAADTVLQVGVPGAVGTAYVFNTQEGFRSATQLMLYDGMAQQTAAGDLAVAALFHIDPALAEHSILFGYDAATRRVRSVERALFCDAALTCSELRPLLLAPASPQAAPPWVYVQIHDPAAPQEPGVGLLFEPGTQAADAPVACWSFQDLERAAIDLADLSETAQAERCAEAARRIAEAGLLAE